MSVSRIEHLKTSLIKRELETTPWEALVELAHKKVVGDVSALSLNDLEKQSIEALGKFDLDIKRSISRLAEYKMVTATTLEIVEHARTALELEYSLIPAEDLETLYRLFMGSDESGQQVVVAPIVTLSKDI